MRKLRILDNKLNESEWDDDLLRLELKDLDFGDFDVDFKLAEEVTFNEEELDEFFEDAGEKKTKEPKTMKCPHCGEVIEL